MAEDEFIPKLWRQAIELQVDSLRTQLERLQTEVHDIRRDLQESVTEVFEKLNECTRDLEERIVENTEKTESIDKNTAEVVEILRDWKGAMRVLKFTATWLAPVGTVATMLAAILKLFGVI